MTGRPLDRLDAVSVLGWFGQATAALERACAEINELNVFPVPDRDTGTNLLVTMQAAAAAARSPGAPGAFGVADAAAAGALGAACGSSGVILACYLRGFADGLRGEADAGGATLSAALGGAADAAYAAVSQPLEGTILSVGRAAAVAAASERSGSVAAVVAVAARAARAELVQTTGQLPALAAADVVDAGGQGLVVVLDAMADVAVGVAAGTSDAAAPRRARPHASLSSLPFAYEVQYLLAAPDSVLPVLRMRLEELGDSVAVVSGANRHNVHVHVNDVGAAIEAALDLGRPSDIRVTHFGDQIAALSPTASRPE